MSNWLSQVPVERLVRTLAESNPEAGVFMVDANRNLVFWSEGAERLLGFTKSEVLGQHCLSANRCAQCVSGCGVESHRSIKDVPLILHGADGEAVYVKKTGQAFFDERGKFQGAVEVLTQEQGAEAARPPRTDGCEKFHDMVGRSSSMKAVFRAVRSVAKADVCTLIGGESGTGKELVARAIHAESARRAGPMVAVNCAAITPALLESELFGHEKGAFTGATSARSGLLSAAHGGTLFLDEVAELSLELQAKLLRVVEYKTFLPVGGSSPVSVDLRIVAATHRSLPERVEKGLFREDLMYRLRVVPITLPPLRKRRSDIPVLVTHFIDKQNERGGRVIEDVSAEAMAALMAHSWPGNVRELQNALLYCYAVGRGPHLSLWELPAELGGREELFPPSSRGERGLSEKERIRRALSQNEGHVGETAKQLGMSRPTLWRKRKKYGF